MQSERLRRRFLQAAGTSLLLPFYPQWALGQASRSLTVEARAPAEQARADAELNAKPRHALVIGNGRYSHVTSLPNPPNDAKAIGEQLRAAKFQVDLRQDLTREAMMEAIQLHAARVAATQSVGLFFFAGHGLQLAWRNFLAPIDAKIESIEDIPKRCVDLSALIEGITKANNPMNVVVLDACRNNPFSGVKLESRGLSQFDAPPRTLLAYATAPGNVASDGEGANGLYTENLLRELKTPEAKIEDIFKRVRLGVRRRSNGGQIPWESTSLEEDFYFLPPKQFIPETDSEANRQFEGELAGWEKVKTAKEPDALEEYLKRYPSGRFSELAQLRLNQVLATQGEQKIRAETAANPFSQGAAEADTAFKVGDTYTHAVLDVLSKVERGRIREAVTEVTEDRVIFSSGKVTDLLGNPLRDRAGVQMLTPQQNFPTEYRIGKRWSTRNRIRMPNGAPGENELHMVVTARERISVPAGTFNAFRIERHGYVVAGGMRRSIESRIWMEPDKVRQPIAQEEIRRGGSQLARADRYELLSFKQA